MTLIKIRATIIDKEQYNKYNKDYEQEQEQFEQRNKKKNTRTRIQEQESTIYITNQYHCYSLQRGC
jgi:hypothetical protein